MSIAETVTTERKDICCECGAYLWTLCTQSDGIAYLQMSGLTLTRIEAGCNACGRKYWWTPEGYKLDYILRLIRRNDKPA